MRDFAARVTQASTPFDETIGPADSEGGSLGAAIELAAGHTIGRHVIVERLGAGAMGVVYSAYDPELDRRIAIKLLREPAAVGSPRRTRMLREAQALARLAHPNVVAIHDVGTLDERVWIAMEFVEGETLAAWCTRVRPKWPEVVGMMSAAGHGLAAAHAVGLVHRDFKPHNVMVDTSGRVRVMDFGLAFATPSGAGAEVDAPAEDTSRQTLSSSARTIGDGLMGTPGYMAPEQLHHRVVDAASDQFAFCVTLWEACYGTRPFVGETVLELSSAVLQGRLNSPPPGRRIPRWLRELALRGLATDPAQRFASMDALLDALARGRTRARRRVAIGASVVVALALGGVWLRSVALDRAAAQECTREGEAIAAVWPGNGGTRRDVIAEAMAATAVSYAATTTERVLARLDRDAAEWALVRTATCKRRTPGDGLGEQAMACLDERRDELDALVDVLGAADATTIVTAIQAAAALRPASNCEDPQVLARLDVSTDPMRRRSERPLSARLSRTSSLDLVGRSQDALADMPSLLADAEQLGNRTLLARAHALDATLLLHVGKFEESARAGHTALTLALAEGRDEIAVQVITNLVFTIGYRLGRSDEAIRWVEIARALNERAGREGGYDEPQLLHHAAIVLAIAGKPDAALVEIDRAIALSTVELGEEHPVLAQMYTDKGAIHGVSGDHREALVHYTHALAIQETVLGTDHPSVATTLGNIGAAYGELGETKRATEYLERSLAIAEGAHGPDHLTVANALQNLGVALDRAGEHRGAFRLLQRALRIRETIFPADHPDIAIALLNLGDTELALQRWDDGVGHLQRALAIVAKREDSPPGLRQHLLAMLGRGQIGQGDRSAAIETLEEAISIGTTGDTGFFVAQFVLAEALRESGGDLARARRLVRAARDGLKDAGPSMTDVRAAIDAWIAAHG